MTTPQPLPLPPESLGEPAVAPDDPDLAYLWKPMEPGELAEMVVESGNVREEDLPPASRLELAARRARTAAQEPAQALDTLPVRERAQRMLARRLEALDRKAGDDGDRDQIAALRELARIAGGDSERAREQRPVADVLADMAQALREHGYEVRDPETVTRASPMPRVAGPGA